VLWNVLEYVPAAAKSLATRRFFENINVLRQGHRKNDKQLRNECLALLVFLVREPSAMPLMCDSGLLDTLINVSVAAETAGTEDTNVASFNLTTSAEDLEMKLCMMDLIATLASDEECFSVIRESDFLPTLLFHLDPGLESQPARAKYAKSQEHEITIGSLTALAAMVAMEPDAVLHLGGCQVLLELLRTESDETVRYGILKVLLACAGHPAFQQQLGVELGGVSMMLSLVNDPMGHPLQLRQDAIGVVAKLCTNNPDNSELFWRLQGVPTMLSCLDATPQDAARGEPLALSVVDCLWSAVRSHPANLEAFLEHQGVPTLLTLTELCPEIMQTQVLSFLSDLLSADETHEEMARWRSRVTRRGAASLLLDIWRKVEDKAAHTLRLHELGEGDKPVLEKELGSEDLLEFLTKCNVKTKVFSVLSRIDLDEVRPTLSTENKLALLEVERYVEMQRNLLWSAVSNELDQDGVRPTTPDARRLGELLEDGGEETTAAEKMREIVLEEAKQTEQAVEAAFFERLRIEHVARQTNSSRLRNAPKPPYVSRTKVIIPRGRQSPAERASDNVETVRDDGSEQQGGAVEAYLSECLADEGQATLLAATVAYSDYQREQAEGPPAPPDDGSRQNTYGMQGMQTVPDTMEMDSLAEPLQVIDAPRGSGVEAARKLSTGSR